MAHGDEAALHTGADRTVQRARGFNDAATPRVTQPTPLETCSIISTVSRQQYQEPLSQVNKRVQHCARMKGTVTCLNT